MSPGRGRPPIGARKPTAGPESMILNCENVKRKNKREEAAPSAAQQFLSSFAGLLEVTAQYDAGRTRAIPLLAELLGIEDCQT